MSYMAEYIDKGLNPFQLEKELMILSFVKHLFKEVNLT